MSYTKHNFETGDILYASQLNEMDDQIAANEEAIENSVSSDMLAEDYSANKTYSIGDYVIYNNELYTCIYEITAPEGWNSSHWSIANLGDGISELNRQISYFEDFTRTNIINSTIYQTHTDSIAARGNIIFPFIIQANHTYTITVGASGCSAFTQNVNSTIVSDAIEEITNWLAPNSSMDFTATLDAKYVRFFCTGATQVSITLKDSIVNNVVKYVDNATKKIKTFVATANALSGYNSLDLQVFNSKQHNTATVYCEIDSSFTGIQFGRGFTKPYASGFCWVTPTTFEIYKYTTERVQVASVNHGLTLTDYVQVTIEATQKNKGIFTLSTGGGAYYTVEVDYAGCDTLLRVNPINCTINNVKLTFTDTDKKQKIWFFGDSYMDLYPQYLIDLGYSNFALDGFSGRNSAEAWESLNFACVNQPLPDTIIWALGMNDADSDAINSSWLSYAKRVENLCSENGIELVYTTIPNTPTRNNNYKNEYIHTSGYRYCDIAGAVEPSGSSTWYSGLLSGDNVHPNTNGSKVIALRVIADIPELLKV